eukprot:8480073-Ditylum_brightwellii.AAC.1
MGLLALPNSLDVREHVTVGSDITQMIPVTSWSTYSLSGCPKLVGWSHVTQHMKKVWVHMLVVYSPVVLGVEFTKVPLSWCPIEQEMPLFAAIGYPVKAHIGGMGVVLADSGVDDSTCCGVVSHDRDTVYWPIEGYICTGGLFGSADGSLKKKCSPALLYACNSDMNNASEWMRSTMSLA